MHRRTFIRLSTAGAMFGPSLGPSLGRAGDAKATVRFGVVADLHHGLQPDAGRRLEAFIDECRRRGNLDFIIQLGDFCHPVDDAASFLATWNRFEGPKHHVLGNHDMDKGTKAEVLARWGMRAPYYGFDAGPFHFVVLDLNHLRDGDVYTDYANANFYVDAARRGWAGPEQLAWLEHDLAAAKKPTVIFAHQPLGMEYHGATLPEKQRQVMSVLEGGPVVASLVGHLHVDRVTHVNGIHYACINSASYHWAEGRRPYRDPLYTIVTLTDDGRLEIEGSASEFTDGHLRERGLSRDVPGVRARISPRSMKTRRPRLPGEGA